MAWVLREMVVAFGELLSGILRNNQTAFDIRYSTIKRNLTKFWKSLDIVDDKCESSSKILIVGDFSWFFQQTFEEEVRTASKNEKC